MTEDKVDSAVVDTVEEHGPDEELVAADDVIIGKVFRRSVFVMVIVAAGVAIALMVWRRPDAPRPTMESTLVPATVLNRPAEPPSIRFTDITDSAGIDFVHDNGAAGDKLLPESMGGGAAFFDFDNDGDQDLLLVNATNWPEDAAENKSASTMGLYRNDGTGKFQNVTPGSGLDVSFYGTGVAVGDYDNDGWVDVFFTAVGANRLFHNTNGRFVETTSTASVSGDAAEWSTGAAFIDYDNDGDLDLFVCNYVRWSRQIDLDVDYRLVGVGRAYGPPMNFSGTYPYLYRNEGEGKFVDVTEDAGLHINNPATGLPIAKSLAVAPIDVDRDGYIDMLIANDTVQNFFLHNQGDGTFLEDGERMGLAYDRNGTSTGAMGIDSGYYRGNDALGFFIGNFSNEMTSVYVSQGNTSMFADEAISEGVGATSRSMLSFGLFLFDYDLDGRLDLLQVNGHLEEEINVVQPSQHYEQPAQLFWNCGPDATSTFVSVDPKATGDLGTPIVGRAATYGDIDADGDLDLVFTQAGRRPLLLRNDQSAGHHWLRVRLVGDTANHDAIGAWLEAVVDGETIRRQVMPTRSYLSQSELPVTFGLGTHDRVDTLRVIWPGGAEQVFHNLSADKSVVFHEGDRLD